MVHLLWDIATEAFLPAWTLPESAPLPLDGGTSQRVPRLRMFWIIFKIYTDNLGVNIRQTLYFDLKNHVF